MIKRIFVTTILTGFLIGIPFLVFKNYKQALIRGQELNVEFKKIESEEIKLVHLRIQNNSDSLLLDSVIADNVFCSKLRSILLELRDNSGPSSRMIYNRTFYLDLTTTSEEHIAIEVYATDITALVLIKTKSKNWIEGLDDVYSSTSLKELLRSV